MNVSEGGQAIVGNVTQGQRDATPNGTADPPLALSHDQTPAMLRFMRDVSAARAGPTLISDSAGMLNPSCSRRIILSVSERLARTRRLPRCDARLYDWPVGHFYELRGAVTSFITYLRRTFAIASQALRRSRR